MLQNAEAEGRNHTLHDQRHGPQRLLRPETHCRTDGRDGDVVGPECVIAAGDIHHFNGVASTQDPLWLTNYEWVYSHPD